MNRWPWHGAEPRFQPRRWITSFGSPQVPAYNEVERRARYARLLLMAVLVTLFASAAYVRMAGAAGSYLRFHPTRQYRSALIARAYYLEGAGEAPVWRRSVATANLEREGQLEPPIVERLAAMSYRLVGREDHNLPRTASILFWMVGGVFLASVARRLGAAASLLAAGYYLLAPFGVMASRSFQPDPLMVMFQVAAILAILRHEEKPGPHRFAIATILSAMAILVKPVVLFQLLTAQAALELTREGERCGRGLRRVLLFSVLAVLPSAAYYGFALASGSLTPQAGMSFLPGLLLTGTFWLGWLEQIGGVSGHPALLLGLLGFLLCRERRYRALLGGLWAGYLGFGLVFTYHVHTHDYYHLQLLPIVALSLAPLVTRVAAGIGHRLPGLRWRVALALGLIFVVTGPIMSRVTVASTEEVEARRLFEASAAPEIGARVHHSTRTIVLALGYGKPLLYQAEISGVPWPHRSDLALDRRLGREVPGAEHRFEELRHLVGADYFVVTDLAELDAQRDLARLLTDRFAVVASTGLYLIFDLRRPGDVAADAVTFTR